MNTNKLRITSEQEVFDGIEINQSNIRKDEKGCFDPSLWEYLINAHTHTNSIEVCELGTWYGYGANQLANLIKFKNKKFNIVCVDTWLGSPEHLIDVDGVSVNSLKELKFKNGYPQFYYDFLQVTKYFGNEKEIIPFPNTTICFLNVCRKLNCKFDFIIIDASHQYEDVKIDLEIAWELLKDTGVIVGDDLSWPGVSRALGEFINKYKLQVYKTHNQYIINKK